MRQIKRASKNQSAIALNKTTIKQRLISSLPFEPIESQKKVEGEICSDLSLAQPMMRLLQGDVGSGKTGSMAMSIAVDTGFQSVLMAPTELLAEQHKQNLDPWFEPLGINRIA